MATRRCPQCGLINPGTTTVCDCGWSFVDETMEERGDELRDELRNEHRSRGMGQLGMGALFLVAGIVITAVTYGGASSQGGTYIIAYGPIAFGIVSIVRGLITMSS